MRKLRNMLLVLSLSVVAATACVVTVWWEGSESSVSFTWTVNGVTPDASSCSAAGATTVRMWISQSRPSCSLATGSCGTWDMAWEWPCSAGSGTTGLEFKARTMYVGWTLLDGAGRVLSATTWGEYPLDPGDNPLGRVEFVTATAADAAAVTTWTIDGAAASTAACTAAGAATVHLSWRESGSTAAPTAMSWPCESPSGTTNNVFNSGTAYDLRWELKTAADVTLSAAPGPDTWQEHTMVTGNNAFTVPFVTAVVPTPDATLTSTWTINSAAADAAACEAATGANVFLVYQAVGSDTPAEVSWACSGGTGTTETVFISDTAYELRWELRTDTGTVLSAAPGADTWTALTPVAGANTATVDLPVTLGRLDLTLAWADKVVDPAYGSCTLPPQDVAVIGYVLETTTGTVVAEVDIDTEPLDCTTALAWAGVPYGDYHVLIDGRAASPATAVWAADCVGIAVDDLLDNAATCDVPMTTP
ncbi:MAG: hypothetical protein JXB32_20130 [Deltaproteobacteria bacterium]|nr:hypothetical protein [Deltaproteobacteria bacterium]